MAFSGNILDIYSLSNSGFNIFSSINPDIAGGFEHQGFFALIDQNGYIRSRDNGMGSPIVYYLGIEDENSEKQGVDMLKEDILKLLNNKNLSIIILSLLLSLTSIAEEKPVDIWNLDKKETGLSEH